MRGRYVTCNIVRSGSDWARVRTISLAAQPLPCGCATAYLGRYRAVTTSLGVAACGRAAGHCSRRVLSRFSPVCLLFCSWTVSRHGRKKTEDNRKLLSLLKAAVYMFWKASLQRRNLIQADIFSW